MIDYHAGMRTLIPALALLAATAACRKEDKPKPPPRPPVTPLESFEKRYGPIWVDLAYAVAQTRDGGFILAGASEKVDDRYKGDYDALLVRVDAAGERVWSESFGEVDADDKATAVEVVDGGFLAAGFVTPGKDAGRDDKQAWIFRVGEEGDLVWDTRAGAAGQDESFAALAVTSRGGIFAAGAGPGRGGAGDKADALLHAFDLKGKALWARSHGTNATDRATGILVLADGTIVVGGYTYSVGAGDGWLLACDPSGEKLWEKTYGGAGDDWFDDIALLPDGGFALAGTTASQGAGGPDGWLVVTDAAGVMKWERAYGSPAADGFEAVAVRPEGGLALAGKSKKSGLSEAWLVLAGADGAPERERTFDYDRRLAMDTLYASDGTLVIAGDWATSSSNYGNFWLWKGKP